MGKDNLPSIQDFNANPALRQTPIMRNEPRYIPTSLFLQSTHEAKPPKARRSLKQNAFVETKNTSLQLALLGVYTDDNASPIYCM